jgi:hypothetical protein
MDKSGHMTNSYFIADGLGNGQISYTSSSGRYHCQQVYHSRLLWFKMVTLTFQTDIGEGPSTSGRKGALISHCKRKKTAPSTSQLKRLDTRHNKHWLMQCKRIQCHVYSANIYIYIYISQVLRMQYMVVCHPLFRVISRQTAFLRIIWN